MKKRQRATVMAKAKTLKEKEKAKLGEAPTAARGNRDGGIMDPE